MERPHNQSQQTDDQLASNSKLINRASTDNAGEYNEAHLDCAARVIEAANANDRHD